MAVIGLNPRQRAFCAEYAIDGNGSRAAIAAGYSESGSRVVACELLAKPNILAEVERLTAKRLKKVEVTAERILSELALIGFARFTDFIGTTDDGNAYVDLSALTPEQSAAIQEVTVEEYTEGRGEDARDIKRTKIKLADKRGSLELLGKYLKMWIEKHEHTGENGGPIRVQDVRDKLDGLDEEQLKQVESLVESVKQSAASE